MRSKFIEEKCGEVDASIVNALEAQWLKDIICFNSSRSIITFSTTIEHSRNAKERAKYRHNTREYIPHCKWRIKKKIYINATRDLCRVIVRESMRHTRANSQVAYVRHYSNNILSICVSSWYLPLRRYSRAHQAYEKPQKQYDDV